MPKANTVDLSSHVRAQGIAEHLVKFAIGEEPAFSAYFMDDYKPHNEMKARFLEIIGVEQGTQNAENKIFPANVADVVLRAVFNEDNGVAFDVTYIGERLDTK